MFIYKRPKSRMTLLSLICILLFQSAFSQQLVNTSENTLSDNSYIFEYSVGEISITTLAAPSNVNFITQGLLQPNIKIIDPACEIVNDTINYFPNPAQNILRVVSKLDWITAYQIYTTDGKLVRSSPFINNQINMYNLAGGAYFIKLFPGCNDKFRILKVIKQ